jgi:fatty-acyl-CoA synthase
MRFKRLRYVSGAGHSLLGKSVGDALRDMAKRHPTADACVFHHQGIRLSYEELLHKSEDVANGFLSLGLQRGSRVGIFSQNCKEWVLTQFGAALSDLVLVNLNPAYRRNELLYALKNVGCEALVTSPGFKSADYLKMLTDICPELVNSKVGELKSETLPALRWVVKIGETPTSGMMNFGDLLGRRAPNFEEITHSVDFESPANIQFTSGTTGNPKGTVLTHHNIVNNGYLLGQHMHYSVADRVCVQVPLYHCFGMVMATLACVTHGSALVFPDYGFNAVSSVSAAEREKCTTLYGVPTMFQAFMNELAKHPKTVNTLRKGVIAGAIATPELMRRIVDELGIVHMVNAYGMTEASPVATATKFEETFEKQISTVGLPFPNTEIKLVNDNNQIVHVGETGEICFRGYLNMKEYWNNPKGTADAIDSNGWLHSGDLGALDKDMYLRIVGRKKDMIIRGGENVFPSEIEAFYNQHPDIDEIHVIGLPDDYYGEIVCAWIKMKAGRTPLSLEDVKKYGEGQIAYYKIPAIVRVVENFPLTVTGKVMKYAMREEESKRR